MKRQGNEEGSQRRPCQSDMHICACNCLFISCVYCVTEGSFSDSWRLLYFSDTVKFLLQKQVNKKNTVYEIQDNTGKMDVLGNGKWHNIECEEGDKLRLFCFQLRTVKKLKLTCGLHSFIQVGTR